MGQAKRRGSFEERTRQSREQRKDSFMRAKAKASGYREFTPLDRLTVRLRELALLKYPMPFCSELRVRFIEYKFNQFMANDDGRFDVALRSGSHKTASLIGGLING